MFSCLSLSLCLTPLASMFWLLVWLAAGAMALDYYDYEYEDHSHTSFDRIRRKSYRSVVRSIRLLDHQFI